MTAPVISDEAVERVWEILNATGIAANMPAARHRREHDVIQEALTAAYPYLLAQITEGVAAEILDQCDDLATTPCRACRQAATITRAYGKATS